MTNTWHQCSFKTCLTYCKTNYNVKRFMIERLRKNLDYATSLPMRTDFWYMYVWYSLTNLHAGKNQLWTWNLIKYCCTSPLVKNQAVMTRIPILKSNSYVHETHSVKYDECQVVSNAVRHFAWPSAKDRGRCGEDETAFLRHSSFLHGTLCSRHISGAGNTPYKLVPCL